jgi:hypothetical protein
VNDEQQRAIIVRLFGFSLIKHRAGGKDALPTNVTSAFAPCSIGRQVAGLVDDAMPVEDLVERVVAQRAR